MFTENKIKKLSALCVITMFLSTFAGQQTALANDVLKGTKALIQIENKYIGKKLFIGDEIKGRLVNNVTVNGKTIIKAGADTYLIVKDASSSRFAGNGGIIQLENGYIKDNNNRYMINFTETVMGKEKEWVKVTTCSGLFFPPLFLAGLVKGGQALIPKNKIYEVEFNGYIHSPEKL